MSEAYIVASAKRKRLNKAMMEIWKAVKATCISKGEAKINQVQEAVKVSTSAVK